MEPEVAPTIRLRVPPPRIRVEVPPEVEPEVERCEPRRARRAMTLTEWTATRRKR
jgi:hypothetical protein